MQPDGEYFRGLPFRPIGRKFSTLCASGNHESRNKKGRKGTSEATNNQPTARLDSPNANALTKKAARNPESIADGGRTDRRTGGRGARVARASERVRKADHDETRENRLRQDRSGILYHMPDYTYIYIYNMHVYIYIYNDYML